MKWTERRESFSIDDRRNVPGGGIVGLVICLLSILIHSLNTDDVSYQA